MRIKIKINSHTCRGSGKVMRRGGRRVRSGVGGESGRKREKVINRRRWSPLSGHPFLPYDTKTNHSNKITTTGYTAPIRPITGLVPLRSNTLSTGHPNTCLGFFMTRLLFHHHQSYSNHPSFSFCLLSPSLYKRNGKR